MLFFEAAQFALWFEDTLLQLKFKDSSETLAALDFLDCFDEVEHFSLAFPCGTMA